MAPTKKTRGRPAANKVTKPAQKSMRGTSGKISAAAAAAAAAAVAKDVTENSGNRDTKISRGARKAKTPNDDDDETDDAEETKLTMSKITAKARGRPRAAAVAGEKEDGEEEPDSVVKPTAQPNKRGRRQGNKSARTDDSAEIPETQPLEAMDIDTADEDHFEDLPAPKQPAQRGLAPLSSVDEDAGEVQLRRRLGEMSRKYESLQLTYRDLRDIGIKTAERNFDNLKKASEERADTASELIGNLKADLVVERTLAKEGQQYKKRVEEMEAKVAQLTTSLAEAKQEVKTLSTKLAASRSAEAAASAKGSKVPGSAVKGGTAAARAVAAASSDVVQTAQLKEDLYGDLTGLIVRVVKRDSTGQVFDCIQTGRNGTLHFKLEVETESSGDNYEEAHFTYKPQLDENRDRDLIDLLPDFLVEEIEFSRPHAAKFYSRVTKSLME